MFQSLNEENNMGSTPDQPIGDVTDVNAAQIARSDHQKRFPYEARTSVRRFVVPIDVHY